MANFLEIPDENASGSDKERYEKNTLGFIQEAIQESEAFLRAQPNYDKIEKSLQAIHGKKDQVSGNMSDVQDNRIAKAATQLISSLTDVRNFWEYRTFNPNLEKTTQILDKVSLHLWLQRQWDMRWADMIRNCATGGSSYAHLTWNSSIMDLDFTAEDVRDVLPIRPADYHTIQTAFGVVLRRERTVNYLRAKYPEYAEFIIADRDGATSDNVNTRYNRLMERLGSPFREKLFGSSKPAVSMPRIPTTDEYTVYLDDQRVNESKSSMYMGQWHKAPVRNCPLCESQGTPHALNNWSYEVRPGERVYPNKRLICATNTKILYDNTSIYWHGMYPVPKLTLQPWSDTFIGKGLVWDALPLQKLLDRLLRVLDNHFQKWQQPDLFADKNTVSNTEFKKINTARPGGKFRFNPAAGKGYEMRYPDQLPGYFFEFFKWLIDEIGSITGAHDVSNMSMLNQIPSADSIDKIMEAMTPESRLRSRVLEAFIREFAIITAYNIAQFWTLPMRIAVLGPGGVTMEDFDYDPGTLLPDYIHSDDFDVQGRVTAEALARGPMPRYNRAKESMRQFSMHIAPGSLLSSSEMVDKLMYLQLARMGMVDAETLANKYGIPNFGTIPGDTILEKLAAQAQMGLGAQSPVGRPPSGQDAPRIKVSESG